jgi:hypothetical protein
MKWPAGISEAQDKATRPVFVFGIVLDDLAAGNGFLNLFDTNASVSHLPAGVSGKPIIAASDFPLDFSQTQGFYTTSSGPASLPAMALAAATAGLAR